MDDGRHRPMRPIVGVGGIVFRGGAVLLVRRGRPPRVGEWSLPGGVQELGETVNEAVYREILEETGVKVRALDIADVIDMIDRTADGAIRYHYTLIDVLAAWVDGAPVAASDATEAAWIDMEALADFGLRADTAGVIDGARRKWLAAGCP